MITVAILTLSDKGSRGEREDTSGPAIKDIITTVNGRVDYYEIIPDEKDLIKEKLIGYSNKVDLILTTGGTGLSPRDVTPDATLDVIERPVPGIVEAIRAEGFKKTDRALLSRAVAGVLGNSLIINLPGSPKAIRESLEIIKGVLPHAIEKIQGGTDDCAIQEKGNP
jgi:molybdenum cofactor synthesis domain-containing protein